MKTAICPVCFHADTMRARLENREPCHDDPALMQWNRPNGTGPQAIGLSRWKGGFWECSRCGIRLLPEEAGTMLDAALMCYDPECDSISDGIHEDARRAFAGGGK